MTRPRALGLRPLTRALAVAALAAVAMMLLAAQAAAVPGTQVWTGQSGGSTPDIETSGLTFFDTAGDPISAGGIAGTLNFSLDGSALVGYCTDTSRRFSTAQEAVDVVVENPPATAERRAVTWILLNRTPTGAPTPATQNEAAVAQVAVWLLVDAQINKTTPTSDAALNAAAIALRNEALAATATPASLALSATTPAAGGTTSTITITGRPGAVVTLSITSGTGTLSASQVTLGAGGTATVTLTHSGAGTTGISASSAGDGILTRINPTDPERMPQPTAAATPTTVGASASVTFVAAQVTPTTPVTPVIPVVTKAKVPKLSITKTAPGRALVLTRVRYVITVRNTGPVAARNVVLRDRLPAGLSFAASSRKGTLRDGVVTFSLGTIAKGGKKTVVVYLLASADVRGSRLNVATVTATRVRMLTARALTVFRPLARRVQPRVTG